MSKKIILFSIIMLFCFVSTVKAKASNYNFTEKEIEYIKEFYGEEFLNDLDTNDYNWIKNLDIDKNGYDIVSSHKTLLRGTQIITNKKIIQVSKVCMDSKCAITIVTKWKQEPVVRSYDVIGARLVGTSLLNNITTKVKSSSGTTYYNNYNNQANGFGCSIKLPKNSSNIMIVQEFYVKKQGTIYASYQHAVENISLTNSKKYSIAPEGMGSVFRFNNNYITSIYDNTPGVDIEL